MKQTHSAVGATRGHSRTSRALYSLVETWMPRILPEGYLWGTHAIFERRRRVLWLHLTLVWVDSGSHPRCRSFGHCGMVSCVPCANTGCHCGPGGSPRGPPPPEGASGGAFDEKNEVWCLKTHGRGISQWWAVVYTLSRKARLAGMPGWDPPGGLRPPGQPGHGT